MEINPKIWGTTTPLFNKNNVEVHAIFVKAGGYCSRHFHKSKFNKFIVKSGKLKVTILRRSDTSTFEESVVLKTNEELIIPPGLLHSFEAQEDTEALEIYWVELDAEDIIRESQGGLKHAANAL